MWQLKKMFFILFFLILVSCDSQEIQIAKPSPSTPPKENFKNSKNYHSFFNDTMFQQFKIPEHQFAGIYDWLDTENVLVIQTLSDYSVVQSFNIFSGEITELYRSLYPIAQLEINNVRDIAIHEATSTFDGSIVIIGEEGKVKDRWTFQSNELFFTWNEYNPDLIMVTTFLEDWSFESYLINTNEEVMEKVSAPNPFLYWFTSDELGYLDWDLNDPKLSAPLYKFSYEENEHKLLLENTVSFHKQGGYLLAIQIDNDNFSDLSTSIIDYLSMETKAQYVLPTLTMYSTIVPPHVDYNGEQNEFYIIMPYESGSLDSYEGEFKLVSLSENGEMQTLLNQVENKPFKLSPDGNFALFGYQLEQIIDFQTETVVELVHVQ